MRNRVSICTLIIGLICPFTQIARGQQSGPVQPAPSGMIGEGPNAPPDTLQNRTGERHCISAMASMVAGGRIRATDLWVIIPLLLATLVGQLTDCQVPDQFELLAPIGPPIPVVCEHSHV